MSPARCPACQGCGRVLGALGALRWYRCRACGLDFSRPRSDDKQPRLPSPAPQSGRRIVNEHAWRRSNLGAKGTASNATTTARNEEVIVAGPRRRTP